MEEEQVEHSANFIKLQKLITENLTELLAHVVEKEQSLTVSKIELRQVYLDAAKQVGDAERELKSIPFTDFEAYGITKIAESFRSMRRAYNAFATGQQAKGQKYAHRFQKLSEEYVEIRQRQLGGFFVEKNRRSEE